MKKKIQIFISSTYTDLIEERQAAVSAILKAGHIPAGMELFTSGDESQMETIKRWINESDIFMLILGGRYGSVEPTTSLSYTELEYDYAVASGKPFFAVVIDDETLEKKVKARGRGVIENEYPRELAAFRKKVLSKTSAFFKNAPDIRLAVYETVSDFLVRHDFTGWVSGNEIPDIQTFTEQINKLREENKRLAEDRNALNAGEVFTPSEEREFTHIRQKLDRDVDLNFEWAQKEEEGKTIIAVVKEIYRVNLLSAIIDFVGKGRHRFTKHSIEYLLFEKLNEYRLLKNSSDINKGKPYGTIKDNLVLELQTYGLNRFIDVDTRRPSNSVGEFTEKAYRFAYWLDYNGYTPKTRLELVSRIEEAVEAISEAPPPKVEIPELSTIRAIDDEVNFKSQRNRWRTTEAGVISAQQEFDKLCEELEHKINISNSESKTFKLNFSYAGQNQFRVSGVGVNLWINWVCDWPDTLDNSVLLVKGEKAKFDMDGVQSFTAQEDDFYNDELNIDMDRELKVVWQRGEDSNSLTTEKLAINILSRLIRAIRTRINEGK